MEKVKKERSFKMPYFICSKCGARFGGWGIGDFCVECGNKLKEVSEKEIDEIIREEHKKEKKERRINFV